MIVLRELIERFQGLEHDLQLSARLVSTHFVDGRSWLRSAGIQYSPKSYSLYSDIEHCKWLLTYNKGSKSGITSIYGVSPLGLLGRIQRGGGQMSPHGGKTVRDKQMPHVASGGGGCTRNPCFRRRTSKRSSGFG